MGASPRHITSLQAERVVRLAGEATFREGEHLAATMAALNARLKEYGTSLTEIVRHGIMYLVDDPNGAGAEYPVFGREIVDPQITTEMWRQWAVSLSNNEGLSAADRAFCAMLVHRDRLLAPELTELYEIARAHHTFEANERRVREAKRGAARKTTPRSTAIN